MKTRIFFILILVSLVHQGWTQETYRHQFSSTPDTSRFEIVQSERGARYTLKIDKYSGMVYQLVMGEDDVVWEEMAFLTMPLNENNGKVNYQVFISGLGARYTFLLNVNTGRTWQLAEDEKSGLIFWSAIQ